MLLVGFYACDKTEIISFKIVLLFINTVALQTMRHILFVLVSHYYPGPFHFTKGSVEAQEGEGVPSC